MTTAASRLLSGDLLSTSVDLSDDTLPTGSASFLEDDAVEVGIWDAGAGTGPDVEADEVFLVLAGRGTVTFADDDSRIDLRPGVLVRLRAGDRTNWVVEERIRKLYVLLPSS